MKNWPSDPRSRCVTSLGAKLMGKYLDVEDTLLKENEELLIKFGLFEED
jgi:hypothetical protein